MPPYARPQEWPRQPAPDPLGHEYFVDKTPDAVARIVERRGTPAFVALLRASDAEFAEAAFEPALNEVLRTEPGLADEWAVWSGDQRWTPSAYVEGRQTGWYNSETRHVRLHPDEAGAVADFIRRTGLTTLRHLPSENDAQSTPSGGREPIHHPMDRVAQVLGVTGARRTNPAGAVRSVNRQPVVRVSTTASG
jgi:hypothetical protein